MQSSDVLMLANGFQTSGGGASATINDRSLYSGDFEVAMDPASSMILSTDNQKHEDLRKMLDGNKENMKLAAMKRIISMVARGKDCSDLFAAVVKNVVSKDPELKKLVYVYLTRYAEDQQDLALLSIATFQKSLKDPNQLIRACALRVLSSIRVPVIVPILMLAIRDAAADLSPYVRKTAAHAIPKLFSLDPEEKDTLIEVVDKLLADKSTLVAGSAVQAFEEVCPDRFDLIHRHFRKLCNLLMDVEEWGQVVILGMLTRYARMQFPNPAAKSAGDGHLVKERPPSIAGTSAHQPAASKNSFSVQEREDEETDAEKEEEEDDDDDEREKTGEEGDDDMKTESSEDEETDAEKEEEEDDDDDEREKTGEEGDDDMKTESSEDEEEEEEEEEERGCSPAGMSPAEIKSLTILHADYRLLISSCRLLLLNRNSAVVMATAQLLYYCATKQEMSSVVRALLRILHSTKEVQHVVLANIATISLTYPEIFEPHLRNFFVFNSDHTQVKLFKLEILTNLITESTAPVILREFQSYVNSSDPEFVATTIQCIGRGASTVPQIAETCLTGLLRLMSRKNERIVAESVIVMRKLLQMQTTDHKDLIVHIAQMVDGINVPSARASILWLLGEYSQRVPRIAPDVLRKVAKTFPTEDVAVKMQILNLAAKLYMYNPRQTELLAQYVFTLAKYDQNYDIRDRSRFFRALIFPNQVAPEKTACSSYLFRNAKKILLATKPAPVLRSQLYGRPELNLGSLSHLLGRRVPGYKDLPDWPLVPPDPLTREVAEPTPTQYPGQEEGDAARMLASRQSGSWRSDAHSEEEVSLCTESDEDLREEGEEEEESDQEQNEEESDQEHLKESQESEDEVEAGTGGSRSDWRRHGRTPSSTESSDAEFTASRPATRRQQPTRQKPPSPDITESATESESETEEQHSGWKDFAPVKPQSNGNTGASKKTSVKTKEKQPSEDLLLLDFDAPALTPAGQTAPEAGSHQGCGLLVPTPVLGASSATYSTSNASGLPPGETKLQLPSTSDDITNRQSADWFAVTPAFSEPLSVEARFLRTISVFGQRGQVNMELRLTNSSLTQSTLFKVCARLPTDTTKAHCSESFPEIPSLPYGTNSVVFFGVNFCESTQPVRFVLMYQLSTVDDELAKPITLDVSIKPPVGELFQPLDMKLGDFVSKQATLKGMHTTTMPLARGSATAASKFAGAANAARLVQVVLKAANLAYLGATLKSPESEEGDGRDADLQLFTATGTILLRFAGRTASGQQDCLVELRLPVDEEEASDPPTVMPARTGSSLPCPGLRVHTEAMSLGLQLAKELVDHALTGV